MRNASAKFAVMGLRTDGQPRYGDAQSGRDREAIACAVCGISATVYTRLMTTTLVCTHALAALLLAATYARAVAKKARRKLTSAHS